MLISILRTSAFSNAAHGIEPINLEVSDAGPNQEGQPENCEGTSMGKRKSGPTVSLQELAARYQAASVASASLASNPTEDEPVAPIRRRHQNRPQRSRNDSRRGRSGKTVCGPSMGKQRRI